MSDQPCLVNMFNKLFGKYVGDLLNLSLLYFGFVCVCSVYTDSDVLAWLLKN